MENEMGTMSKVTRGALGVALAIACGCGGAQKVEVRTAGSAQAQAKLAADPAAVLEAQPAAPAREISKDARADFAKALADYAELQRKGPLSPSDCDHAARAFREVAKDNPNLLEARYNESAVLYECGKRAEAVQIWRQLAGGRPPFAPALSNLGFLAWQEGRVEEAEATFRKAIDVDVQVGSIGARLNLAQILREKARRASKQQKQALSQEAVTHLRTVLALDGNNLQAYAGLCFFYFDMEMPEMARLVGQQALARAEEIATGKFVEDAAAKDPSGDGKGKGKGKGAKEEEAPAPVQQVAGTGWTPQMKKQIAYVQNTLGLVALRKKNVTEAIASFRRAVELDPELHEARMNLGALALNFRDYATAEENFRAVVAAQPKNYEAVIGLGVALRGNRKVEEAEQQYLAAQKLDPQRADSYFNLGLLYQEYQGSQKPVLQKAQQYYRDFIARSSDPTTKKDAEKRIKDIDELFVALEEIAKLQREAEEMQRKAEEQQKKMEEEMRKMQELERQQQQQVQPPPDAPPAVAPPSS